jgi:hypothetical protein
MNCSRSSETSKEARDAGLVVRYDTIEYRGQEVNFLSDFSGVQCFAQWQDELIDLGLNNIYYKEDMCRFIDRRLDLITTFSEVPELLGAKLEWFHNGDFRDIRLLYKGRVIKVFVITDPEIIDISFLINKAKQLLYTSGLLEYEDD